MAKFAGSLRKFPARASFFCYALGIMVGAAVLASPICTADAEAPISPVDALFTATSATCVTGLTVRSTGNDFSWVGQLVILLLIQLGGIGIITITTYITFSLGATRGLRSRTAAAETIGVDAPQPQLAALLRDVLRFALTIEAVGFGILFVRWLFQFPPHQAAWYALFHSVSAFCNAGFSLFDDNLVSFQADPVVLLTIAGLIITGGLGFPVITDLHVNWHGTWREMWDSLRLHTRLSLLGTAVLLAGGTLALLALEWDNLLAEMPWWQRLLTAFFQSVTPRTAGFNSVPVAHMTTASLFLVMLLMLIGACPCSTGGGFKVSTFTVLVLRVWALFRGRAYVSVFRRTIPQAVFGQATATVLVYTVVVALAVMCVLGLEERFVGHIEAGGRFLDTTFEVVSAAGTVGLSTGATTRLSTPGRLIIVLVMFLGRLGPISVFAAVSQSERYKGVQYVSEKPLIG